MKLKSDEWLKLTTLDDGGERVLDIRVWRRTSTGGVPTKKAIIVNKRFLVPLILGLQKVHREDSVFESRRETAARG